MRQAVQHGLWFRQCQTSNPANCCSLLLLLLVVSCVCVALLSGMYLGAKIGVLGANGAGKSSLMRILAGVDDKFDGKVVRTPGIRCAGGGGVQGCTGWCGQWSESVRGVGREGGMWYCVVSAREVRRRQPYDTQQHPGMVYSGTAATLIMELASCWLDAYGVAVWPCMHLQDWLP